MSCLQMNRYSYKFVLYYENETLCDMIGINTMRRSRSCQATKIKKNSLDAHRHRVIDPYSGPTNQINRYVIYRHLHGSKFKIMNSKFEPKKRRFNGLFSF